MMFSAKLIDAFHDYDIGVEISYWIDGKLFNLRRLQAKTKLQEVTVHDLLFADVCFLNARSESGMQWSDGLRSSSRGADVTGPQPSK
ncbi:hypothetical protein Y1Q_0023447 [Alligator mississippiensis]|uniref:Uncharacterized protein n=1 Tax=Alligator mississippiensis TaxID=8496 RepID=A0A151NQI6_ALLMI|nr:hypothetical protein Y1Q_0023447 [Alligator mississippiensis]